MKIEVSRLDSGVLQLRTADGTVIKEISRVGNHYIEVYVPNNNIYTIDLVAVGTYPEEKIVVNSCWLHRITPRLKEYMTYIFTTGGGTGVTHEELQFAINQLTDILQLALASGMTDIASQISAHLSDINPHRITPELIHAATEDHGHTPESIGAADRNHSHLPDEIGAAPAVHEHTPTEVGLSNIPNEKSDDYTRASSTSLATSLAVSSLYKKVLEIAAALQSAIPTEPDQVKAAPAIHTHTQYLNESQITTLVEQMLLNSGSTKSGFSPLTIESAQVGSVPEGMELSNLSEPVVSTLIPKILHTASGNYDYTCGYASASIPETTVPVVYAFKELITTEDITAGYPKFQIIPQGEHQDVQLAYTFHTDRTISGYRVLPPKESDSVGVITEWTALCNGAVYHSGSRVVDDLTILDTHETILDNPVTGTEFGFKISAVDLRSTLDWMFRVEFIFADVSEGHICVSNNILVTTVDENSLQSILLVDIPQLSLPTPGDDNIKHLYVKQNDTLDLELAIEDLPPEYSAVRKGTPGLLGTYTSKTHSVWGTIAADYEDILHPVENLYKNDTSVFSSGDGVTSAIVTHQFLSPVSIRGQKLVFLKEDIVNNVYPDTITIEYYSDLGELVDVHNYNNLTPNITGASPLVIVGRDYITPYPNISSYRMLLTATRNQSRMNLCKFIPYFDTAHFNTASGVCSPSQLIYLGALVPIHDGSQNYIGYKHHGLPIGRFCNIPIDNFEIQPQQEKYHKIRNPFNSTMIECFPYSLQVEPYTPSMSVVSITTDWITVRTESPARYSLKIQRLW